MNPEQALLTDRVAIVTGSGQGIGSAIARCLAAFGAHIVTADINEAGARSTAEEVRAKGRRAVALRCDVTKQPDVDRMMEATLKEFGQVDILVNNAGRGLRKLFMDMTEQEWYEMLDVNLVQTFRCTKAAARVMMDQGIRGSIINITTIEAYRACPGFSVYATAKAGLANFTKTMALELCPWGIRVNAIAPDATATPGMAFHRPAAAGPLQGPFPHLAMGRRGTPEDFGGAALYLASDLSAWVTGEVIHVGAARTRPPVGYARTPATGAQTAGTPQRSRANRWPDQRRCNKRSLVIWGRTRPARPRGL